jgi:hypothetical protein
MLERGAHDPAGALAGFVASAAELAGEEMAGSDADALAERVVQLAQAAERADAALLSTLAVLRGRGGVPDGHRSLVAWLVRTTGMDRPDAHRTVRTAQVLADHDRLAKAVAAGDVTSNKARTLSAVVIPDRRELFAQDVDALVDTAATVSADELRLVARRWADHADDQLGRGEPARIHDNRGVWHRRFGQLSELIVRGLSSDVAVLLARLDRTAPPDPADTPGGTRSLAQRRYDALTLLGALPDGGGRLDPEHTVNILIDWETLHGGFDVDGCSQTMDGIPVDPANVARLVCDSWLVRVILSAEGEVLDLGRRTRLFSAAQRKALLIEHGGCAVCGAAPQWCDIHHLDPWQPEGETNKANGLPLCRIDHTRVHEHGWQLSRTPAGQWMIHPP